MQVLSDMGIHLSKGKKKKKKQKHLKLKYFSNYVTKIHDQNIK